MLGHGHGVQRVPVEPVQFQREGAEHEARHGLRRAREAADRLVEAAVVEQPDHLADQPVGLLRARARGQPVQDLRSDSGQRQFAGKEQPDRAGAHDDDIIGHSTSPSDEASSHG